MSYGLSHLKLDIGGPDGNVYVVVMKVTKIIEQVEGKEVANAFREECFGKDGQSKFLETLGGQWDYEDILRHVINKTGITLVSNKELPIASELYTIESQVYL